MQFDIASQVRRRLTLIICVLVLLAGYTAAGFALVPHLLRSGIHDFSTTHYARSATVGEIRFNPYTLTLEMRDFSMPDADGAPLLAFNRLLVNMEVSSLWRRGASFKEIEIDAPLARVLVRADGSLNLADLSKPFESKTPPPARQEPPTRLFIDRFQITAGQVSFEDRTHASPFQAQLKPITFELREFSTTEKSGNVYNLHGQSAAGERFDWSGAFSLSPFASRGKFEVAALQARTLWSYLRDSLAFEISSGVIGLTGDYDFAAAPAGTQLKATVRQLGVADLGIKASGQAADYVHLKNLEVGETQFDLARRHVDVGNVRLAGGEVHAWRNPDGAINLLELSRPSSTATPTPAAAGNAQPQWTLAAPSISIESLALDAEDRQFTPAAKFSLRPVNLQISDFSNAPGAAAEITADIGVNDAGKLTAKAKVVPDSGALSAHIDLSALDLTVLQPYIGKFTQAKLRSGTLATKLDIDRTEQGELTVKGETQVAKLRAEDNELQKDFIRWDQLRASGIEYRTAPAGLRIAAIDTSGLYARVIIAPDRTSNIVKILSTPGTPVAATQAKPADVEKASASPAAESKPFPMAIGMLRITNGSANFADYWIQPNYAVSLQGMNGTLAALSSDPHSRAKLKLEGKVDRYAPASIDGEVNLLSASLFSDIKMRFQGVDMTSVTPYSGRFAGYRIEKGKLSVDLSYRIEDRKLSAEQRFVIDQLQLGEKVESPDAVKLPLKLAVALLKDRNGVIDLGLPLSGSLDDPQFSVGPLIWKVVVNLITKAVTAPFALLGRLFGGGEEMNLVDFAPGQVTLDPAAQAKITGLAKSLKERPQLQLDVPMTFDRELDRPTLAAKQLNRQLRNLAEQQAAGKRTADTSSNREAIADPVRRFDLLVTQYRTDLGKETPLPATAAAIEAAIKKQRESMSFAAANSDLENALLAKIEVPEGDLEELGRQRARAIQDALLAAGDIDSSRVFLILPHQQTSAAGKVRLEMSLK